MDMEELEKLRQDYRDNPCFETRFYLASKLFKCGLGFRFRDRTQGITYLLEAIELLEENYRENPRHETRHHLAKAYRQYAAYSRHSEFFLKAAELYEIDVKENPCIESRVSLSHLYYDIIWQIDNSTPDGIKISRELYLKKISLDEANYNEDSNIRNITMLGKTYQFFASLILTENGPDALIEAEEWLMKALDLHEKDFNENPKHVTSRENLLKTYHDLIHLERRKNTPESRQKEFMWQKKIDEKFNNPFRKS